MVACTDRRKEDTVIGPELQKTIHLHKFQDHFDLFERTSSNTSTSVVECTKSTRFENTQEEHNPSNNEISLDEG